MRLLYSIFFMLMLSLTYFESKASHAAGADLFYRWVSDSTYEFTAIFYRNCMPGASPAHISTGIRVHSKDLDTTIFVQIPRLPTSGVNVPTLQPPNMYNCTQANLCYEEYMYRGQYTLPGKAKDWIFEIAICCRPGGIRTPYNTFAGPQVIQATLNNLDFPDISSRNSSPVWHDRRPNRPGYLNDTIINYLLKTLCVNNYYEIDMSTREYDGDSIVYEFIVPGTPNSPVRYRNGYTFNNPLPTINGIKINKSNGEISLTPTTPIGNGVFIIAIKATEYRLKNSTYKKIGSVMREMTIWLDTDSTCVKDSIHPQDIVINYGGGDTLLDLRFKDSTKFNLVNCKSIDPSGKDFKIIDLSDNSQVPIGKATWKCKNGATEKITLHLNKPLNCGIYDIIIKNGLDNNTIRSECGFWEPPETKAKLTVRLDNPIGIEIEDDTITICYPDSQIILNTHGNSGKYDYIWKFNNRKIGLNEPSVVADSMGMYDLIIIDNFKCVENDIVMVYLDTMPQIYLTIDPYCDLYNEIPKMPNKIMPQQADTGHIWEWYNWNGKKIKEGRELEYPDLMEGRKYILKYIRPPILPEAPSCIAEKIILYNRDVYPPEDPLTVVLDKNEGRLCVGANDSILVNLDDYNIRKVYLPLEYYWIDGSDTNIVDTTSFTLKRFGLYQILVKDSLGCWGSDKIMVVPEDKNFCTDGVFAPNVFTPNNDGINDYFYFLGLVKYPNSELTVFDRWGKKILYSSNYKNDWDGENYPEGTYLYVLKINDFDQTILKGVITLLR